MAVIMLPSILLDPMEPFSVVWTSDGMACSPLAAMPRLLDEIITWVADQGIKVRWFGWIEQTGHGYYATAGFDTDADATLFRLRWC